MKRGKMNWREKTHPQTHSVISGSLPMASLSCRGKPGGSLHTQICTGSEMNKDIVSDNTDVIKSIDVSHWKEL